MEAFYPWRSALIKKDRVLANSFLTKSAIKVIYLNSFKKI